MSPYVLAGAAAYVSDYADGNIVALRPQHIGIEGGIGIEGRFGRSTLFAELRYMTVSPGGVVPLTMGMRF